MRILDAALERFAAKGYDATTIADIEQAAGLSVGAGGTYRHFGSKGEILREAIALLRARRIEFMEPVNDSAEGTAFDAIELGRRNADMFRLLFRDLEQFPELRAEVVDDLMHGIYRVGAERLQTVIPDADVEALAVVLCHATVGFTLLESLLGVRALDVDDGRFARAWARMLEAVIAEEGDND